jgi:serine/threonine-protein kinase RsbW
MNMNTSPSTRPDDAQGQVNASSGCPDGLLLKLELRSDPRLLCAVRGALERLTELFHCSAEDTRAVTRAVDEALTNIMRHAYLGKLDQPIEVVLSCVPRPDSTGPGEGLEILLCDHGPPVDPEKFQGRRLDDIKPGGLGLHLIHQSMDSFEYRREGEANLFRLVKYFESVKHAHKD